MIGFTARSRIFLILFTSVPLWIGAAFGKCGAHDHHRPFALPLSLLPATLRNRPPDVRGTVPGRLWRDTGYHSPGGIEENPYPGRGCPAENRNSIRRIHSRHDKWYYGHDIAENESPTVRLSKSACYKISYTKSESWVYKSQNCPVKISGLKLVALVVGWFVYIGWRES